MKIKRLKGPEDLNRVSSMLEIFYEERPDSYGLMDRAQADYDLYAAAVRKWMPLKGKVLDLGCGTYRTPLLIQQQGFKVTGCDLFSEEKLKEFRKALPSDGPILVRYDGHTLPFEDYSFDAVSTLCVFEHVPDIEKILHEIRRVLKPSGRLIILGPNLSGPHRAILGLISLLKGQGRYWQFETVSECLRMLLQSFGWFAEIALSARPKFIHVWPFVRDGKIDFEQPDDDAIHLNCPLSYKKWFRQNGFVLKSYNRAGDSKLTRLFNRIFPSFATTIYIVAQKKTEPSR